MNKTQEWAKARKKLKVIYEDKEITSCELGFKDCWHNNALGFHHRHKRKFYYSCPELLGEFNQTILCCNNCHDKVEDNRKLNRIIFKKLR